MRLAAAARGRRQFGVATGVRESRDLQQPPGSVGDRQIDEFTTGQGESAAAGRLETGQHRMCPFDFGGAWG